MNADTYTPIIPIGTGPRPHDLVVTVDREDHAPVPGENATVCGIALPADTTTHPRQSTPCRTCWRRP